MTIHMDMVYDGMVSAYRDEIESSLREGMDHFTLTFDSFRLQMKALKIIGNKQTAKEKWENMILDQIAIPLGKRQTRVAIEIRPLLKAAGVYDSGEKNKKIFFTPEEARA